MSLIHLNPSTPTLLLSVTTQQFKDMCDGKPAKVTINGESVDIRMEVNQTTWDATVTWNDQKRDVVHLEDRPGGVRIIAGAKL